MHFAGVSLHKMKNFSVQSLLFYGNKMAETVRNYSRDERDNVASNAAYCQI